MPDSQVYYFVSFDGVEGRLAVMFFIRGMQHYE